jgi:hypothetical protein
MASDHVAKGNIQFVTLVDPRRPWYAKFWRGLLSLATVAAAASAAYSAYQTREIGSAIAREENTRSRYDKYKYTAEVINRYNDYATRSPGSPQCRAALADLSDQDLAKLLGYETVAAFGFNPSTHKSLIYCLNEIDRQNIQNSDGTLKTWTKDHSQSVRSYVLDRFSQIDVMMLSYIEDIANKRIICEYTENVTTRDTPTRTFILRVQKSGVFPGLIYLWKFMDEFKTPRGCGHLPRV